MGYYDYAELVAFSHRVHQQVKQNERGTRLGEVKKKRER